MVDALKPTDPENPTGMSGEWFTAVGKSINTSKVADQGAMWTWMSGVFGSAIDNLVNNLQRMKDRIDDEQSRLAPHQPLDRLVELPNLLASAARTDRVHHAMLGMVSEQLQRDALERRPGRVDLGEDVDAVAILLHHFLNTANLTFDAPEPCLDSLLVFRITWHLSIIPPTGIVTLWTTTTKRRRALRTM